MSDPTAAGGASAAAEYLEHITVDGERWDGLAERYYGDPLRYEPIVVANSTVPITPILPSGLRLQIPLLAPAASVASADLPPWKQ